MGSGKTSLFHLLTGSPTPEYTVTSIEETTKNLKLSQEFASHSTFQDISVSDFPGSHKLKDLLLYPFISGNLNELIGIVYILDSSSLNDDKIREVSNDLLKLFKLSEGKPNGVDLLVFCNKSDLFTSKKKERVKTLLEEGIRSLIKLEMGGLDKVDVNQQDESADETFIGGINFKFQSLEGNVTFSEGNIWKDDKRSAVFDWVLEKIANT